MRVEVRCKGSHSLYLSDLTVLQGDLKSLSEKNYRKLRKEILELGFSSPIHIWVKDDKNYILDGTQRTRTLNKMAQEGIEIPALPVVSVDADDINDAKRKVLALTSQYGKMESQGLYEFMSDSDITVSDIEESFHFPELDMKSFEEEFFDIDKGPEDDLVEPPDQKEWLIVCELRNEDEQAALFEKLSVEGIKCKIM